MNLVQTAMAYADGARILSDWLGAGGIAVDSELAQRRADTCLKCPHNSAGLKLVESVANAVREQIEFKNSIRLRVEGEKELHTCSVCLCANRLKVWTPLSHLTKYMKSDDFLVYPDHCWLRTETKT